MSHIVMNFMKSTSWISRFKFQLRKFQRHDNVMSNHRALTSLSDSDSDECVRIVEKRYKYAPGIEIRSVMERELLSLRFICNLCELLPFSVRRAGVWNMRATKMKNPPLSSRELSTMR